MAKTIEEIFQIPDIDERIKLLKYRKTELPDAQSLLRDWDPSMHDVMDKEKRPDMKLIKKEAVMNYDGTVRHPAEFVTETVNRIPLPLEQDIVNIHTAFTVGINPKLTCEPNNENEEELLKIVHTVDRKNKIRYHNKRIVRSWLSETEVAEYWYSVKDSKFWPMIFAKIKKAAGIKPDPAYTLKATIWSPFRGDTLYPYFDDNSNLVAFSREYKIKNIDQTETTFFHDNNSK
jgi:hypothetical protein